MSEYLYLLCQLIIFNTCSCVLSLEQFKLDPSGICIRVEIDLVLPDTSKKKLVKYLSRIVNSMQPEPIYVHNGANCNNWVHLSNHSPKTLRNITCIIPSCIDIVTLSVKNSSRHSPVMPSLAESEATRIEPHTTRYFGGVLSQGEEVTLFTLQV